MSDKIAIKVIGVGGGGCNAVQRIAQGNPGLDIVCINTDQQSLDRSSLQSLLAGPQLTSGRGTGGNPQKGREAGLESINEIGSHLENLDVVFITAGLGGGTGTGMVSLIAKEAKSRGVLTICVVTTPFAFEGNRRSVTANECLGDLVDCCDALLVIANSKLLTTQETKDITMSTAFALVDDTLFQAVSGLTDLIQYPGIINLDFNDIKTALTDMGLCVIGMATAEGKMRAIDACNAAISNPLLELDSFKSAKSIVVNITSSPGLKMSEYESVGKIISEFSSPETNIYMGLSERDDLGEKVKVTIILAGIEENFRRSKGENLEKVLQHTGSKAASSNEEERITLLNKKKIAL